METPCIKGITLLVQTNCEQTINWNDICIEHIHLRTHTKTSGWKDIIFKPNPNVDAFDNHVDQNEINPTIIQLFLDTPIYNDNMDVERLLYQAYHDDENTSMYIKDIRIRHFDSTDTVLNILGMSFRIDLPEHSSCSSTQINANLHAKRLRCLDFIDLTATNKLLKAYNDR